ncbi:MAG: hypothetical protein K2Y21_13690 [Phycisphaerales bacterium]|nr:hypothetical protein [Phycisphaerales bacterium]
MNTQLPDRHAFSTARTAFPLSFVLAVAAATAGVALRGSAASEPPAARPAGGAATSGSVIATDPRDSQVAIIEELNFPGGTVKQYVEAVEAAIKPLPLNVVYVDRGEQAGVQAVRLRRVAASSAMRLLFGPLTGGLVSVEFSSSSGSGDVGVFVIRGESNPVDAGLRSAMSTRVFSLREWTVAGNADELTLADSRRAVALGAIEEGLSLSAESKPGPYVKPTVRYHAGSGLLFVLANPDDHRVAESIVKQIDESFRVAENAKKHRDEEQKQTLKMLSLQREVDTLRAKLDTAKKPPLLSGVVRVREDIRAKVLDVAREVTKQYGSIDGNLEISETPKGIQLKGPADLVHYAVNAARAAAMVLGDDDAEFQEQSLPR